MVDVREAIGVEGVRDVERLAAGGLVEGDARACVSLDGEVVAELPGGAPLELEAEAVFGRGGAGAVYAFQGTTAAARP